jgi:hypothetical protein
MNDDVSVIEIMVEQGRCREIEISMLKQSVPMYPVAQDWQFTPEKKP